MSILIVTKCDLLHGLKTPEPKTETALGALEFISRLVGTNLQKTTGKIS